VPGGVGTVEAEARHVLVEPRREPLEHAAGRVFLRDQLQAIVRRQGGGIDDVHVRAPVVAAAARQRRPAQDGVDPVRLVEGGRVHGGAGAVEQRPLAAPLAVPDRELPVEVAKTGGGGEIDAGRGGGIPHRKKRRHRPVVHRATRLVERDDVGAGASGELEFIHALVASAASIADAAGRTGSRTRVRRGL
jgi:hypothetical protein